MRSFAPLACAVVLALAGPTLAQPKDPAELFPAQTLAYLEVRQPDKLAREAAALVKGSALEDLAAVFAKARTERGDNPDEFGLRGFVFAELGMVFSPEALAELGRLGGGAVAVTGWNKDDGPEVAGVIYPGECNLVTMYLRAYLAADPEIRIADRVEGVNLYRARGRDYSVPRPVKPGEQPPPPPIKDKGPTFALMPGLAVIASTPRAAKDVVRRAKGRAAEPSLASLGSFKRAATLRDRPGAFGYADVAALAAQVDETVKGKGKGAQSDWAVFKGLVNPQGLGTAAASLTLQNGNLDFRLQVQVDPRQPCPLLGLLPDKKAPLDALHFAPRDGLLTVTLSWPDGEKHWEKVLALVDAVAKGAGTPEDGLPSKQVAAAEQLARVNFGKDVFAKVAGFTLTVDPHGNEAKSSLPLQLAVTATDEDAAKALQDVVPKLLRMNGRRDIGPPELMVVDRLTLLSYTAEGVPWQGPFYTGRHGKTLVLGGNKEAVAAALRGGMKNGGLLGEAKVATALKDANDALVVGVGSLPETLAEWVKAASRPPTVGPAGRPGAEPKPPPEKPAAEPKFVKELAQAAAPLPPTVVTLSRKGDVYLLEAKQTGLKTASAKVINFLVDAAVREMMTNRGGHATPPNTPPIENKP